VFFVRINWDWRINLNVSDNDDIYSHLIRPRKCVETYMIIYFQVYKIIFYSQSLSPMLSRSFFLEFWTDGFSTLSQRVMHGLRRNLFIPVNILSRSVSLETRERSWSGFKLTWFHNSKRLNCLCSCKFENNMYRYSSINGCLNSYITYV